MTKYEYKVAVNTCYDHAGTVSAQIAPYFQAWLSNLGEQGWEVVSVNLSSCAPAHTMCVVCKKEKS